MEREIGTIILRGEKREIIGTRPITREREESEVSFLTVGIAALIGRKKTEENADENGSGTLKNQQGNLP